MRHTGSPSKLKVRRLPVCGLLALTAAACSPGRPATRDAITVVDGRRPVAVATPVRIAAPVPTPLPTPSPSPAPRRRFTSPPLPPELVGDGGLKPLPARPPADAFGQGEQH